MVSKPTVLILGAGASRPYGFPTGPELAQKIRKGLGSAAGLKPVQPLNRILLDLGFKQSELLNFATILQGPFTVDSILEHHPDLSDLGKSAIAATLVPIEYDPLQVRHTLNGEVDADWYAYLFQRLTTNLKRGNSEPLTIITFNYDRSFEHYFYFHATSLFGANSLRVGQFKNDLRVIHVHGELTRLPWQGASGEICRPYEDSRFASNLDQVRDAARRIRVNHETKEDDDAYKKARAALTAAHRICFLGFGYHDDNVKRLLAGNWLNSYPPGGTHGSRYLLGSGYGLSDDEANDAKRAFNTNETGISIDTTSLGCRHFLANHMSVIR